ncbi:uncharacterized protein LOC114720272 [Neltuma alba]|uniref:uncharacterized protein LOC114720272 n=1 Tax=Neltuma alba TaxID=207710 RepID=UPI0010A4C6CF|nr:uncharacterized protein LOC114720272 [Prosopis alba]
MAFQNSNLVVDESYGHQEITHSNSRIFTTLILDDQNCDLFAQLHEIPQGYSISSPQTADSAAAVAAFHQELKRNKFNPELTTWEKLQVIAETLKPIPFRPSEALDFKSHELLLRRLGLWDFVNIEFDTTIRSDLLAQLIASYTPNLRGGYVNGIKIMVNKADLGRALKLPAESTVASTENMVDMPELGESVAFIEKLVLMWMLLHDNECIMPPEVLTCIRLIKEGHLEMIDWAGLIWSMVDRELNASQLENCYYASHLQHLIKTQRKELLREECKVGDGVSNKEELLREHSIELNQGQGDVEIFEVETEQVGNEHSRAVEDFKEESGQWPLLRQCNVGDLKGSEEEQFVGEDEDEDECILLEGTSPEISSPGMPSGGFIQAMEAGQMPFSSGNGLNGNSEDFFAYREDAQMVSGPSLFGNGHKRYVDQDDHNLYRSPTVRNKRLRSDGLWDAKPVDFNMCMEHMQHLMGEARMMYVTKAQACEESSMNEQILLNELQSRDKMIEDLRKAHVEESQKGRLGVYMLERELNMMENLLEGYRKALKETQQAFTEYRIRCQQASEPLYKDVPGSEGLVLSIMELEQERLKQEQEQQMKSLVIDKAG